jgi:hypothetical protein
MGECEIPITIAVRQAELQRYTEELDRLVTEFERLKQSNDEQVNRKCELKPAHGESERASKYLRSSTKISKISSYIL